MSTTTDDQMTAGRLRLAKDELGVARGAVDGIERILTEMEFRAAHMEQTDGRE